jgi:hypothetical protein
MKGSPCPEWAIAGMSCDGGKRGGGGHLSGGCGASGDPDDGRVVFDRPIRPSDAETLRRAISEADPETLHGRFMGSPPRGARWIPRLVQVDYVHGLAAGRTGQPSSTRPLTGRVASRRHPASALVLAENWRVLALLRASGLPYSVKTGGGTSEIVIRLARFRRHLSPEMAELRRVPV